MLHFNKYFKQLQDARSSIFGLQIIVVWRFSKTLLLLCEIFHITYSTCYIYILSFQNECYPKKHKAHFYLIFSITLFNMYHVSTQYAVCNYIGIHKDILFPSICFRSQCYVCICVKMIPHFIHQSLLTYQWII